jgi:hypothetical protein
MTKVKKGEYTHNNLIFKLLLVIAIILMLFVVFYGTARAEELNLFEFNPLNLQGDTIYLLSRQDFGMGIGWTIATLQEFIEIRAESVFPIVGDGSSATLIGVGVGVNIPKLVEKLGGQWFLSGITSSIGLLGLMDFNAQDSVDNIEPAIYLTVVKVKF